jgi:hypothetical protein
MFDCSFVVLWQTAFASRLAPTLDNCTRQKLVGCQAAITAGWLPQGLHTASKKPVGFQAAFAGKPAPTGLRAVCKNWSAIRPPSPAGWLSQGLHTASKKPVGFQAAFAGKPAPTGLRAICKNWSAVRPPSLASQLPQDCVQSARTGRHSGRLRWQASSHRDCVQSARTGRLSGRHRWQACFHRIACVCKNWSAVRPPSLASQLPQKAKTARIRFSPLNTMSVSSSTAFDLDPRATSGG